MPNEEVVVQREQPVAEAPKIDEAAARAYLKDRYGIDDDPDTFKSRRERWEAAEQAVPKYHATLSALLNAAAQVEEETKAAKVPVASGDDEAQLREVARLDPLEGAKRLMAKERESIRAEIATVREETEKSVRQRLTNETTEVQSFHIVRAAWPDALNKDSELHKLGKRIYNEEMDASEKSNPRSFLIATERAAGRLGIAPVQRNKPSPDAGRNDSPAQNVERGNRRPRNTSDETPLNAKEKRMLEMMELDPKVFKAAQTARREGKNLRVDN